MSDELKRCPFCGGPVRIVDHSEERMYFKRTYASGREYIRTINVRGQKAHIYYVSAFSIGCCKRNCIGRNNGRIFKTRESAIEAWNKRSHDG